ncbi:MAG TPA: HlyD family type I secretion periplasmic adaptor subunit, partial [Alphaproteobacteria bacterium]|nr:HlyD family type I secretion periplasmic adaptor subunit [Alphaproteobacteria bacterium]
MNDQETTGLIAAEEDPGRATHLFLGLCIAFCVGFIIWASFGVLDIVSVAMGEVIPSSQVKTVQHLEGGI